MRNFLLNNVLPFWAKHAVDYECGGLFNMIDREGKEFAMLLDAETGKVLATHE